MRRALVSQTRVPEIDRDSGSQRIDLYIRWLLEQGWQVTFVSSETDVYSRHCRRLRREGVATFVGYDELEAVARAADFDLALLGFWEPASRAMEVLRRASPRARVIVDSIDLHFLREARRGIAAGLRLDERVGGQFVAELNVYQEADAVLTVSGKEAELLGEFIGDRRVYSLPDAKLVPRSRLPWQQRRGMVFIGNFRHLPNGEAVEYLCRDVLPRLDPQLLAEHPLWVIGSRLDDGVRAYARGIDGIEMVGWVPDVVPYLERARAFAAPLLHGAGVKGKLIESMAAGTPVVTTSVGAEGMGLVHGEHGVVADDPEGLAAGLAQLLVDRRYWAKLAEGGHELIASTHSADQIRDRFLTVVEEVLALPVREPRREPQAARVHRREAAYRRTVEAVRETLPRVADPGEIVLVVSRGDDRLTALEQVEGGHFPQDSHGGWAGHYPSDSDEAIEHLESLRRGGARYLAFPASALWWLHQYRSFGEHLDREYRRVHSDEHLVLYDLGEATANVAGPSVSEARRVRVVGSYRADRAGPPANLVSALERSSRYEVSQRWSERAEGADTGAVELEGVDEAAAEEWTVLVSDEAVLPAGFLDEFLGTAEELLPLGVRRCQPAHDSGPQAGPPVTERHRGVIARELAGVTPIPLLAVRGGSSTAGSVALLDATPIALASPPLAGDADPLGYSDLLDVFVPGGEGPRRAVRRGQASASPLISVVIATYRRPQLLAECLEGFCGQTVADSDFEVIVVDDGSEEGENGAVLERFAGRLPIASARIEHSGRSAAKNIGVMLARGEVVLFFDDDDLPAPDLLEQHLLAHERHPSPSRAVLGRTQWNPDLEVSPLMHYVTEVGKLLFSYSNLEPGQLLDWRGFWEGRVSSKRALHLRHGLHDQRLEYSIDVEMAWRLAQRHGLEVAYEPAARSFMSRGVDLADFCDRIESKGRAQAAIAKLHDDPRLLEYLQVEGAEERWQQARGGLGDQLARVEELEASLANGTDSEGDREDLLEQLHGCYRAILSAHAAKGLAEGINGRPASAAAGGGPARGPSVERVNGAEGEPRNGSRGRESSEPALTVTMPVWSRTRELAEMAARTVERVWEVARLPTEVVVVDNGSPERVPMAARVHRLERNTGVAAGWNTGIALARAPVIAVLNSDCTVEPGWDEALYEAVETGRRIAFPYTDHCDGEGFRQPDQAGTAGWCFMLTRELYEEIGPFDERFSPAYVEDTDYWHRAWELGVELAPVPAARVVHARRTSADTRAEWLLTSHRYLYGWKHGVEPMRAPPFYNREITEYRTSQESVRSASTT